jgi:iron-sulfur cluster repair protein YtfE (RIC family)
MRIKFVDRSPKEPELPITSFTRCHLGIVSQLEKTARLPELVDAARRARQTATDTLALFQQTVLPHHAEEEAELFPAVLSAANAAERARLQPVVDRLIAEHRTTEALWKRMQPVMRAAERGSVSLPPPPRGSVSEIDAEGMEELVRKVLRHARYEETVFLPVAERILSRNGEHMAALGLALHLRHAPLVVGYV